MTNDNHTPTILVVDDDPEERASTCKVLGSRYPVLAATSGEDALRMAHSARPSAIVMDVMMAGGMDGFTTFHELQDDPATRDIPVIFLTNVGKSTGLPFGSAELGKYLGREPAAFLEKSASADELLNMASKFLDGRKGRSDAQGLSCKQS